MKRQDTRSQLIAAAQNREKLIRTNKSLVNLLTKTKSNEDVQAKMAAKLLKRGASKTGLGVNEANQREASARSSSGMEMSAREEMSAKSQAEKTPTKVGTLARSSLCLSDDECRSSPHRRVPGLARSPH
jgi:hypothetical protein